MAEINKLSMKTRVLLSGLSAVVVVVVVILLTIKFTPTQSDAGDCATPSPTATVLVVNHGLDGLSAYDLWIASGNTGTKEQFLAALVGKPGPTGYSGSNGISGANGRAGRAGAIGPDGAVGAQGDAGPSAYQLWLDAGNTGTSEDFLVSLLGVDGKDGLDGQNGIDGVNGLSAYDLWVAIGNVGEISDFIAALKGSDGANGADGANGLNGADGLSAYEIWVANGNEGKTVAEYLASLRGEAGTPGTCTVGDAGKSAYELWLAEGNEGTVSDFLASLKGDKGDAGSGLPFNASFSDNTVQKNTSSPNLMRYNAADAWNNGIRIDSATKSRITFDHPGVYNIQFSTQFAKTDSGTDFIDIWLRRNGSDVPMSDTQLRSWGNDDRQVAAWNFFVEVREPGEYYELAWQSRDTNISLLSTTANGKPGIPSVILTVTQVY